MTWSRWIWLELQKLGWSFLAQWHRSRMRGERKLTEPWKAHFRAVLRCSHNAKEVGRVRLEPPTE